MHRVALRSRGWLRLRLCHLHTTTSSTTTVPVRCSRRLCSATASGSSGGNADSSAPTVKVLSPFRSFDGSLAEVRTENVPSAKEVSHMLPSARKLSEDLPSAAELEAKYMQGEAGVAEGATERGSSSSNDAVAEVTTTSEPRRTSPPAAQTSYIDDDDVREVRTAMSARTPGRGGVTRQHWLLAYRALFWGTVYATLGFLVTVAVAMYLCGYRSLSDLRDGMRAKVRRDELRLQLRAAEAAGESVEDVKHMVIDLGGGLAAWQQVMEVWQAVQELAEAEAARADE